MHQQTKTKRIRNPVSYTHLDVYKRQPRIRIRGVRQDVLKKEMAASDKVRIQYASKYAGSSNYWKNSIGMNTVSYTHLDVYKRQV